MRAALESWLHERWAARGPLCCALTPLSLIYRVVSHVRASGQTPVKLPLPVIVVGNIYIGGTGKTPVTIELARVLRSAGYKPGVVSRGYGGRRDAPLLVGPDSAASLVGDEPLLIARAARCPTSVGRDRVAAGQLLIAHHPEVDVLISDDGLQHRRLARDIELAVVGARGLGNGWTLPAGPLRDPPSRLDRVTAIVLNGTTDIVESRTPRFAATSQLGRARCLASGEILTIDQLAERVAARHAPVLAAAGIASPERFFAMLRAHDIVCDARPLGDHFSFARDPFRDSCHEFILITAKDAVKCEQSSALARDGRLWSVDLETRLDPYLIELVLRRLRELRRKD